MSKSLPSYWTARSFCETCQRSIYTTASIPENRRIGLPRTHSCGEELTYQSQDISDLGQRAWGKLSKTLTFYSDPQPPHEIDLGEENV